MAIKIIKYGNKQKFTKTCPVCGCEFEYELSDVEVDYSLALTTYPCKYHRYVKCPECGDRIYHDTTSLEVPTFPPKDYYSNGGLDNTFSDCANCPNRPDPMHLVAGDTPCSLCRKNVPYCTSNATNEEAKK